MTEAQDHQPAAEAPPSLPMGVSPSAIPADELDRMTNDIVAAMKTVYDPEIPVDIYELGLIYGVQVSDEADVVVQMTLTAPSCPAAGMLPGEVETKVRGVPGVKSARVDLVWDPPWNKDMMSEAAKLQLGFF